MTCHDAEGSVTTLDPTTAVVALVGNPNVGKSTLFNVLTGARQSVVNAPGTTVEMARGRLKDGVQLLDLPGAYSLLARSPDEEITADALHGPGRPSLAVVLVDATALSRSLYMVGQVGLTGTPVVVAVSMLDVARARGVTIDLDALAEQLGVPVVGVDPRTGRGADQLELAIHQGLTEPPQMRLPDTTEAAEHPATELDQRFGDAEPIFAWVAQVQQAVSVVPTVHRSSRSDRVDSWLLRPWVGVPIFLVVLWGMFQLVTVVAAPLMDAVDWFVADLVGGWVTSGLDAVHAPVWLTGLLVDGVLSGVATVASFAPLVALVFVAVGLFEDSGYLARASFIADRTMRTMGLDGRAVLPIVVGFGCNLPALASLRLLPNARQRLLTALLIPFTSCTARLVVYLALAMVFFPGHAGTVVFALYVLSALLVVGIGLLLRHTGFRQMTREPLVLALPAYQRPRLRALATTTLTRTGAFVKNAGRIIIAALVVLWLLTAIPVSGSHPVGDVPEADSLYGRTADVVSPVFAPAGFDDRGTTAALIAGFFAKEVVVGELNRAYGTEAEAGEDVSDEEIVAQDQMVAAFDRTSGGHASVAALAFLVFVLVYVPCVAVAAELIRQIGLRWAALSAGSSLLLAWVLAVAVFQVGSRL